MRFLVLARGQVVGSTDLPSIDTGMGIVRGLFHPNENYASIQPIIRSHMIAESVPEESRYHALEEARKTIRKLELRIQGADGGPLKCDLVHVTDYSAELDKDAIEIDVLGFSIETRQKFWPNHWNVS